MSVVKLINSKRPKQELWAYCESEALWPELLELVFGPDPYLAWRSLWLLADLPAEKLTEWTEALQALIDIAPKKQASFQREAFKVLAKISVKEEHQSAYLDWAEVSWLDLHLISSVRIMALRALERLCRQYPALKSEVLSLNRPELLESLSPGIQQQAKKIFHSLAK